MTEHMDEEVEQTDMTLKGRLIRRMNLDMQKAKLSEYFTSKGVKMLFQKINSLNIKCPIYKRYYLTIIQYVSELSAEKLAKLFKNYITEKYNVKVSKKQIHFIVI